MFLQHQFPAEFFNGDPFCLFVFNLAFLSWELSIEMMELQHTDILHTILNRQKGLRLGIEEREEKGMVPNLIP